MRTATDTRFALFANVALVPHVRTCHPGYRQRPTA